MKLPLAPILLMAAAPALSGCAMLAVPLATGVLVSATTDDDEPGDTPIAARESQAATDPRLSATPVPTPVEQSPAESLARTPDDADQTTVQVTSLTELPAPTASDLTGAEGDPYAQLYAQAMRIAQRDPFSTEKRYSAFLADPTDLDPERKECAFAQSAVLIDLDPDQGEAPLDEAAIAPARLARILATLREQEIAVLWLSRHTAARAGAVRRVLRRSGLDPQGQDDIYLVRYEGESKATRRADAASDYCVIAMLGDTKSDFDDLFGYLKDPEAALALDSLFGEAWFLAPAPLTLPSPPEEG